MTRAQRRNADAAARFARERVVTPRMVLAGERHEAYPHRAPDYESRYYVRPAVRIEDLKPRPAIDELIAPWWRKIATSIVEHLRVPGARLVADVACCAVIAGAVVWVLVAIVRAAIAGTG